MVENDKSEGDEIIEAEDFDENLTKAEAAKKIDQELRQKTGRGAEPE
jgi:Protein of unknown function (DUF3072)